LERTPRGRKVTLRAWEHLGKKPTQAQASLI
jgi:Holliday junction resolvasome RuvABC ATP-dependent DNA helicase subunit